MINHRHHPPGDTDPAESDTNSDREGSHGSLTTEGSTDDESNDDNLSDNTDNEPSFDGPNDDAPTEAQSVSGGSTGVGRDDALERTGVSITSNMPSDGGGEEIEIEFAPDEDGEQKTEYDLFQEAEQHGRNMAESSEAPRTRTRKSTMADDYVYLMLSARDKAHLIMQDVTEVIPEQVFLSAMASHSDKILEYFTLLTEQMTAKKGLKFFGEKGAKALRAELEQLLYRKVMHPVRGRSLTWEQKLAALRYLMFLKEKRSGKIKGRGCADGRKQRLSKSKDETRSPTVTTESFFLSCLIDAHEGRDVATADIPGAFMQANIDEVIHILFDGDILDQLLQVDPSLERFLHFERGRRSLYTQLDKAL